MTVATLACTLVGMSMTSADFHPTPARIAQYKRSALRAANKVRDRLGLPPVSDLYPGVKSDETACPITATVYDDDLDRDIYYVETSSSICVYRYLDDQGDVPLEDREVETKAVVEFKLPERDLALKFIRNFDAGNIPELEKKRA